MVVVSPSTAGVSIDKEKLQFLIKHMSNNGLLGALASPLLIHTLPTYTNIRKNMHERTFTQMSIVMRYVEIPRLFILDFLGNPEAEGGCKHVHTHELTDTRTRAYKHRIVWLLYYHVLED